jgi:THO complex subunit 4
VSNLPTDVNEAQIKVRALKPLIDVQYPNYYFQELFSMQIGPTKEVTLHYDNAGRSKGIASVLFSKRGDGTKAYQQYHNRLIDGS